MTSILTVHLKTSFKLLESDWTGVPLIIVVRLVGDLEWERDLLDGVAKTMGAVGGG